MIKITYLDHSSFVVTTDNAILVFDYYRDPSHSLHKILTAEPQKPVTFFVSHRHPDHFNPDIFGIAQNHRRTYVLSNDVRPQNVPDTLAVAGMSPGDAIENLPGIRRVKAYGSTDVGVSYFVTLDDGTTVFHAGDLNLWHWKDLGTPAEAVRASAHFDQVLHRITDDIKDIDVAMFPVDPRQGTDFAEGATRFLQAVNVKLFIPMHFWNEAAAACDFPSYVPSGCTARCECLSHPGQHITL